MRASPSKSDTFLLRPLIPNGHITSPGAGPSTHRRANRASTGILPREPARIAVGKTQGSRVYQSCHFPGSRKLTGATHDIASRLNGHRFCDQHTAPPQRQTTGYGNPVRDQALASRRRLKRQHAKLNACVNPRRKRDRAGALGNAGKDSLHMSHLWTSVRIDALNRQSHDAPRDYHLGRSKAPGIEHQRARRLF